MDGRRGNGRWTTLKSGVAEHDRTGSSYEQEGSQMRLAIVILAAGKGTRLKSKRAKVLHEIGGKALLRHVIDAAFEVVPAHDVYVVVGHQAEQVQASVAGLGVTCICQQEQRGTGHAVREALETVKDYEHLLVLSGDVPLIRPQTIARLRDFHLEQRATMIRFLTAIPRIPAVTGASSARTRTPRKYSKSSSRNRSRRNKRQCGR